MYVLLDTFELCLVTDEEGEIMIFDSHDEADEYGNENLQMHQVVYVS